MSSKVTVARPYTKAAFMLAEINNTFTEWLDFLDFFRQVLQDRRVVVFLKNPTEVSQRKVDFLINICSQYTQESCFLNFIRILVLKNRLFYIFEIYTLFKDFVYHKNKAMDVTVITAVQLSTREQKILHANLTEKYNKQLFMTFSVNTDLLGGVLIKAGNKIFDKTIKGSLTSLRSFLLDF